MAIIEAYASGTPVLGSRYGAVGAMVEEDTTGALFERGDASGLAAAVLRIMSDPKRAAALGRGAREAYLGTYAARHAHPRLVQQYREALRLRGGRGAASRLGADLQLTG